jgi:TolA-binding protein
MPRHDIRSARCLAFATLLFFAPLAVAQVTPEQAADMLLTSARRAYNEKNYPFAAARFREFLTKFPGHKEVPAVRYGLALSLVDGPERDYDKAIEQLNALAGMKDFPEYPHVLYFLGLAQRGMGNKSLALAASKPTEAATHRAQAQQRFEEASKQFGAALTAFSARVKDADPAKPLPVDLEWAARARCDQAEMQLRVNKAKDALTTAAPFTTDKLLAKSRYQKLGLYYHGFACFLAKDYLHAGRSLSRLAPFSEPIFGTHARYLLARIHHHDGERQEAATHYDGVLTDYAREKTAAAEALKTPDRFKNDPEEKARLEALARGPVPDHVGRATFFLGVMRYEDGRFAEAQQKLNDFQKAFPTSLFASEAQLRLGFCQVQLKQYKDAVATLRIVAEKEPRLADQALLWIGKAQVGFGDPNKPNEFEGSVKVGIDMMRKAAERAAQLAERDPEAKARRAEILLEMADAMQLVRQHKEAAAVYNQVLSEKQLTSRDEEVTQRLVEALHLAGDYAESDKACTRFVEGYPKSTLLAAVLFRFADNAYFSSLVAEKNPNAADRARDVAKWTEEAIKRYQVVVDKYPEFAYVNLARYGLAQAYYRKGDMEKAKEKLESIPADARNGEMALVPYQLADVLIRLAPTKVDDAVSAGKLEDLLKAAAEQLEGFVGSQPKAPQTPDAYLKLGHCHQRMASVLAEKADKAKALNSARASYEQVVRLFPKDPAYATAVFELAKCLDQQGDVGGAMRNLYRFRDDGALKTAPVAPMGLLHLATLLRRANKSAEAADLLNQCRQQHEATLLKDPARAGWVPLLQYHQGVALKEAGKRPEARAVFDLVVKSSPDRPEAAEAALRWGQALKDDGELKIAEARKKLASNLKPEEMTAAKKMLDEGVKDVQDSLTYLTQQADRLKEKQPASEARARMLYETAWANRTLAALEIESARTKIQNELWQKRKDEIARKTPEGKTPPPVPKPDVPLAQVPLQSAEKAARTQYRALIEAFPDLTVNADARFELAEILSDRGEPDEAIKQLKEALDKEPSPELTAKVRVRLGGCYLAKGDTKAALAQLNPIASNDKNPLAPQAMYRVAECLLHDKDYAEATKRLTPFRDHGPYQNIPGLSDRALLRLGHALEKQKQWDASRQAHEALLARFPNSPWVVEGRYGIGWARQNAGQHDDAVNAYNQVVSATATELAAKAQLNIGLCRLAQKRYADATTAFLVVPYTYDYPHLSALALLEAARAFAENNQKDQAVKLLERLIKDHADSEHAEAAKKRLEELKKG